MERDVTLTRDWMVPGAGPFFPRILLALMADPAMEIVPLKGGAVLIRVHNFDHPEMGDQFLEFIDGLDENATTGLVFDLRFCMGGRGDIAETMISALVDKPLTSPLWRYPKHIAAEANWDRPPEPGEASNTIHPRDGRRYLGPVVALTSGVTSSTAEDLPITLRAAGRAVVVGENTAGSAGNPVDIPLPGGGTFGMATFRAYLPDGGEYVGIGAVPDVAVTPSLDDLRSGTDPVLAAALEALRNWEE
jgi:carboxyl-terminal processing protease